MSAYGFVPERRSLINRLCRGEHRGRIGLQMSNDPRYNSLRPNGVMTTVFGISSLAMRMWLNALTGSKGHFSHRTLG